MEIIVLVHPVKTLRNYGRLLSDFIWQVTQFCSTGRRNLHVCIICWSKSSNSCLAQCLYFMLY